MRSVTRKAHGDRTARRAEMRARMLEAVETLLEQGETFTELSVERIRSEAGVSRSTFYVYFEDKGHLLATLTEDVTELMLAASREWWDEIDTADYPALERTISNLFETYRAHATLMAAIVDTSSYDPNVRAAFNERIVAGQRELAEQIRRGQQSGLIRAGLDPERTAAWLSWMVEHGLHQLVRGTDDPEAAMLATALARILWNALYEPTPIPPETPSVSPVM